MDDGNMACSCESRAWTWQQGDDPEALVLRKIDMAELGPNEVLVRNAVIGLNPVDWKVLGSGDLGWSPGHVPGVDGAGMVIAVGEDVPEAWLGKRVCYHQNLRRPGSFAQYTAIDARALMQVPEGLDLAVAASFPCPGLTAWLALEKIPARRGASLLISGAGGAVGQYLVQLAAISGYTITAMCNPRHWERMRTLGAAACVSNAAVNLDGGYYAVIDSVNGQHAATLAPLLAANGHLVCIQGRVDSWPDEPFTRAVSLHEVALGPLHTFGSDADWLRLTDAGEQILSEIASGRLTSGALLVEDFDHLPRLLNSLKHRDFSGKPLIRIS